MGPVVRFVEQTSFGRKAPPSRHDSLHSPRDMIGTSLLLALLLLQRTAAFGSGAPLGTGLEWMTVAAVVLPAVLLVLLVYAGSRTTV